MNGEKSIIPKRPAAAEFDPEEIRRLVTLGKKRGLIQGGDGRPVLIEKDGEEAASLGRVRSQWMDVTPEKAELWLKNNFKNRSVSEDVVKAYARDMINGIWVPTHQGIAFNDKDELIDGQHRLRAIVLSRVTVRMMVTFGLPSQIAGKEMTTMDAVDRGRPRSVADQLTIQHGMKHGTMVAAICTALGGLCYGERTRRLTVGQTIEVFRQFEEGIHYVIEHRSREIGLRSTGVLAGFAFALMTEDAVAQKKKVIENLAPNSRLKPDPAGTAAWDENTPIAKMMAALNTGEGFCRKKSAMEKLRGFLTSDESKLFMRSLDRGLAELVLQAIWMDLKGEKVEKLHAGLDGLEYFRGLQKLRVAKTAGIFKLKNERALDQARKS